MTRFRWVICALLFGATTINYVDRLVFGTLAPELQKIFHWSNADIPDIALWFEVSYAIGLAFAGRILDRVGTKLGFAVSLAAWCLASMLHAGMSSVLGFIAQNVNYAIKSTYLLALLEPYTGDKAPATNAATPPPPFEDMVAKAQPSVVLILVY